MAELSFAENSLGTLMLDSGPPAGITQAMLSAQPMTPLPVALHGQIAQAAEQQPRLLRDAGVAVERRAHLQQDLHRTCQHGDQTSVGVGRRLWL